MTSSMERHLDPLLPDYMINLVDHLPLGAHMYQVRDDGNIVFIRGNKAANEILGFDHEPLCGKAIEEAFPGLAGTAIPDSYRKVALEGGIYQDDHITYDDGIISGAFDIVAFRLAPGMMTVLFRDILERKKIEISLKETEENFRSLLNAVKESIVMVKPDGTVITVNETICRRLKSTPEEMVGKNIFGFFSAESAATRRKYLNEVVTTGQFVNFVDERVGRYFETFMYPIADESRTIDRVVIYSRDITEQRQNEIELASYAKKLEKINESKDKFFHLLAHDLKDPFNVLKYFASKLESEYENIKDDDRKTYINQIHTTSRNLYHLILTLLDWARLQKNNIEISPVPLHINKEIQEITELMNTIAFSKQLHLQLNIPDHLSVLADRNMFRTILLNLFSNAVKFTHEKGNVFINARKGKKFVFIEVIDTGVGMTVEEMRMVFRIDSTLSKTGTAGEKGTGLGLIVSKEMIELMGGKIDVSSSPGSGTTFTFSLPAS